MSFAKYLQEPIDHEKLRADLIHLQRAVEPHITGSKRVPVRVASLRRVLASYDQLSQRTPNSVVF